MASSKGLIALAFGTFALGVAEFSMMGILTVLSKDLEVSIPQTGDFISAYALGVSIGAPLPIFFRNHPRKHILLGLAAAIVLGNLFSALSNGYCMLLISRLISGLPHGGFFGVGAIVAVNMVEPGRKATAVAIMVTGMTLANMLGVPLVTWLTFSFSWRYTFILATISGLLTFLGVLFWIPLKKAPPPHGIKREFSFLLGAAPWMIFIATFLGQGSIYCWYSYMEPIMQNITHIPPHYMKWVMTMAGTGMLCGSFFCARLADRYPPALVSACTAFAIIPILMAIYYGSGNVWISLPAAFLGAAALFGLGGPMQYLIVRFSRGGEILGGAGIQIAFNMSNAFSAFLGGYVISSGFSLVAPALFGIPMAIVCTGVLICFYFRYRDVPL